MSRRGIDLAAALRRRARLPVERSAARADRDPRARAAQEQDAFDRARWEAIEELRRAFPDEVDR